MYGPTTIGRERSRRVGLALLATLAALAALVMLGRGVGLGDEPCLLLVTVEDADGLGEGAPVFYRGLQIGKVVAMRPPSAKIPGWRLRLAVERAAFVHISTDARVRLEAGKPEGTRVVVILPGILPADPDYPIDVKMLAEVSTEEEAVRMFRDVLGGLSELSRSKRSEAEVIELREEIDRLRRRLAELEADQKKAPRP